MKTFISFYPVGCGDCNLLEIENGPKMMWDCRFTNAAEENDETTFNVIDDLLSCRLTQKVEGLPFLDAFILTHADKDHCQGFDKKFYLGNPDDISESDKEEQRILIGELWYSPRVIVEHEDEVSEPAQAFKNEAERRLKLFKENPEEANKDGNRIRIVGWAKEDKLEGAEDRIVVPGSEIAEVNGKVYTNFRIFIHAPFKDFIDGDRNETSIVMQIRIDCDGKKDAGKLFMAGDAEWSVWEEIMANTTDESKLAWNLLEAPHHCSWSFFSDDREKGEMNDASVSFLNHHEDGAIIVSSSKRIISQDSNPPCLKAKNRYVDKVGRDNFYCTGGENKDEKPQPLTFRLTRDGFVKLKPQISSDEAKAFAEGFSNGKLRFSNSTGLSMAAGKAMSASKGLYGYEE